MYTSLMYRSLAFAECLERSAAMAATTRGAAGTRGTATASSVRYAWGGSCRSYDPSKGVSAIRRAPLTYNRSANAAKNWDSTAEKTTTRTGDQRTLRAWLAKTEARVPGIRTKTTLQKEVTTMVTMRYLKNSDD